MVSKKKRFGEDEIAIFDDGCIYKRGDYWHFRLWLRAENKYARKSLLGVTNQQLAHCRPSSSVLEEFRDFLEDAKSYLGPSASQ